jgi:hypothetical protein
MGYHDVVADFDGEQGIPLKVGDKLAEWSALGIKNIGEPPRQFLEGYCRSQQGIEPSVAEQAECSGKALMICPPRPV